MSAARTRFRDLCDGWALGTLTGRELEEFRELLAIAEPEMIQTCLELEMAAQHLAVSVEAVAPPPAARERLLRAVRTPSRSAERVSSVRDAGRRRPWHLATAAVIAALSVVALSLVVSSLTSSRRAERLEVQLAELADKLSENERLLEVLHSKELEIVSLRSPMDEGRGHGKLLWDTQSQRALLQVTDLPPVPTGMEYQIWLYPETGGPLSVRSFLVVAPHREILLRVDHLTELEKGAIVGFGVTLEPAGETAQPTEPFFLVGRVPW